MHPLDGYEKLAFGLGGTVLAWLSWLTRRSIKRPDREEVKEMVQVYSPYRAAEAHIKHQLESLKESNEKLEEHMDAQSEVLHTVSTEIVKIRTILDERTSRERQPAPGLRLPPQQ